MAVKKQRPKKTRISVPLREDTYNLLMQMSEEQGFSMSSLASQMITSVLQTHKKLYESIQTMMSDPQKLADLQKLIGEANIND